MSHTRHMSDSLFCLIDGAMTRFCNESRTDYEGGARTVFFVGTLQKGF